MHARSSTCGVPARRRSCSRTASSISCRAPRLARRLSRVSEVFSLPHDARAKLDVWRAGEAKIVFTNGVFDLLHRGHVEYLEEARALGDRLVVGLNSDASARRLKG